VSGNLIFLRKPAIFLINGVFRRFTMKIEFSECKVDSETVQLVAKFSTRLEELPNLIKGPSYDSNSLPRVLLAHIAQKVADEWLKENKAALIKSVDLKMITDAVQLKIVEGFSLQRSL
jgi:hypothetical protein